MRFNAWSVRRHIVQWEQREAIEANGICLKVRREAIGTVKLEQ